MQPRQVITHDQLASGFTRLLSSADDLLLDVPDALRLLSLFLGRAVVDELLPPAFLTQVRCCRCAEWDESMTACDVGCRFSASSGRTPCQSTKPTVPGPLPEPSSRIGLHPGHPYGL